MNFHSCSPRWQFYTSLCSNSPSLLPTSTIESSFFKENDQSHKNYIIFPTPNLPSSIPRFSGFTSLTGIRCPVSTYSQLLHEGTIPHLSTSLLLQLPTFCSHSQYFLLPNHFLHHTNIILKNKQKLSLILRSNHFSAFSSKTLLEICLCCCVPCFL